MAVRAAVAVGYLDQIWADEHYQTLEPAATLVWDFGAKTWEWQEGVRSWAVPALYVPVLALVKAFGVEGGAAAIIACRLWMVLASAFFLACFARALNLGLKSWPREGPEKTNCRSIAEPDSPAVSSEPTRPAPRSGWAWATDGPVDGAVIVAFAAVCFTPALVAYGAATLSDAWALLAVWAATASALETLGRDDKRARRAALHAGLWLGLAFVFRIQTAVFSVGVVVVLGCAGSTARSRVPRLLLGLALPILGGGLLDWATWGAPFHSTVAYARAHLLEGTATLQGTLPWHAYASLLLEQLGPITALSPWLALIASVVLRAARFDLRRAMLLVPSALYVVAHAFVPHKEARFLLPALPALFVLGAAALQDLAARYGRVGDDASDSPRAGWRSALWPVVATVALGTWTLESVRSPRIYQPSDASDAARFVREDGGLRREPEACWAFVDQYWVWARGELMQGHRVRRLELSTASLDDPTSRRHAQACAYALTGPPAAERAVASLGAHWRLAFRSRYGFAVFRNERALAALFPDPTAVPLDRVPSEVIVRTYEEALAREPGNRTARQKFAEFCRARRLPCALTQYEHLLREDPTNAALRALRDTAAREVPQR